MLLQTFQFPFLEKWMVLPANGEIRACPERLRRPSVCIFGNFLLKRASNSETEEELPFVLC